MSACEYERPKSGGRGDKTYFALKLESPANPVAAFAEIPRT